MSWSVVVVVVVGGTVHRVVVASGTVVEDCVVGTVVTTPVPIEAGFSGRALTCEAGDVVCDSGGTVVVEVLGVVTDGSVEVVFPPMTTGRRS